MLLSLAGGSGAVIKLGELVMILDLHQKGLSVSAIARQLCVDRKTVRSAIARGLEPPKYKTRAPQPRITDSFEPYLKERLAAYPGLTAVRLWTGHLSLALGVEAVKAGRSVFFGSLADIIGALAKADREGALREKIRFFSNGKEVWVTVRGENYVSVLDGTTYEETARIDGKSFEGVAVLPSAIFGKLSHFMTVMGRETYSLRAFSD
jgi:IstB-like ATP binding protein